MTTPNPLKIVGRYTLFEPFATGGMATVHLAHVAGSAGFSRVVAAKRMKPEYLGDTAFVNMFHDEARLASRVSHPNVVPILDVVRDDDELVIVMEYVRGTSLRELLDLLEEEQTPMPVDIAASIVGGVLEGLHAAHGARGDDGWLLGLVHRDVSPQNILVGVDGVPRLVDFGVAKAVTKLHVTAEHEVRGKLRYMAPERVLQHPADLRVDVYSAGIVLWEMLANRRRYFGDDISKVVDEVLKTDPPKLAGERDGLSAALDHVVARATARMADARYTSTEAMLSDLEAAIPFASKRGIATWLARVAEPILTRHEDVTKAIRARAMASSDAPPVGDEDPTQIEPLEFEPLPMHTEVLREMSLDGESIEDPTTTTTVALPEKPQQTVRVLQTQRIAMANVFPPREPPLREPRADVVHGPGQGVGQDFTDQSESFDLSELGKPRSDLHLALIAISAGLALLILVILLVWRA